MTNILVECPQKIASVRVGVLEPLRPLVESGLCQVHYRDTCQITREDIMWSDVVICVRGCEYPTLRVIQSAKAAGRFCIYFLDDDLLNIPDSITSTNYYRDKKIRVNLTKILSLCDVLWAVNQRIIQKYARWVPRKVLMRVPAETLKEPVAVAEKVHILYAGSVDHSALVQEVLAGPVKKVLQNRPGKVDFTFIGADPGNVLRKEDAVQYYAFFEDYEAYRKAILDGGYLVGLAPAYDAPFYACKYFNKFIEYSSCGIAGIYSDCEPYTQIIQQGQTGILCENTDGAWAEAIQYIVDNPEYAAYIATNAENLLREEFTYEAVASALQKEIPELVAYHAQRIPVYLPPMRLLFYQERLMLLCRMYGIKALWIIPMKVFKKIWKIIGAKFENE